MKVIVIDQSSFVDIYTNKYTTPEWMDRNCTPLMCRVLSLFILLHGFGESLSVSPAKTLLKGDG